MNAKKIDDIIHDKNIMFFINNIIKNNKEISINELIEHVDSDFKTLELVKKYLEEKNINIVEENIETNTFDENFYIDDSIKMYLKEINSYPLLTKEEEKTLAEQFKINPKAKEKFINSNLRLVVSVAKRYIGKGIPFLDLIQEGNIGLIKAVDKYDVNEGCRFSTYGIWWIRQAIIRTVAEASTSIRIPYYINNLVSKFRIYINNYSNNYGYQPSNKLLAKEFNLPLSEVDRVNAIINQQNIMSLDETYGEKNDVNFGDFIESNDNIEEIVLNKAILDELNSIIECGDLSDIEKEVIIKRYGLKNNIVRTYDELSDMLKINKKSVKEIEKITLHKLRMMRAVRNLRR